MVRLPKVAQLAGGGCEGNKHGSGADGASSNDDERSDQPESILGGRLGLPELRLGGVAVLSVAELVVPPLLPRPRPTILSIFKPLQIQNEGDVTQKPKRNYVIPCQKTRWWAYIRGIFEMPEWVSGNVGM